MPASVMTVDIRILSATVECVRWRVISESVITGDVKMCSLIGNAKLCLFTGDVRMCSPTMCFWQVIRCQNVFWQVTWESVWCWQVTWENVWCWQVMWESVWCWQVCAELEDEKRKHAQDTAQGDDVTYMLEKDRERLKQEVNGVLILLCHPVLEQHGTPAWENNIFLLNYSIQITLNLYFFSQIPRVFLIVTFIKTLIKNIPIQVNMKSF